MRKSFDEAFMLKCRKASERGGSSGEGLSNRDEYAVHCCEQESTSDKIRNSVIFIDIHQGKSD